jgi:inosine-uridine nucleoside N-ribohydrolase
LSDQADESVVMIQVGNSANFAALLDSPPDTISELNGLDLIKKKVRFLSVMAGAFQDVGSSGGRSGINVYSGINIYEDVPSAQKIFDKWPTPIVVSGVENAAIQFPGISINRDFSYGSNHPIAEAYRHSCVTVIQPSVPKTGKCPHNHHTADLTATLYALRPDRDYFSLSKPGKITVSSSGNARFSEEKNGDHRFLVASELQKIRAQEAMMMLVSQPPAGSTRWSSNYQTMK